MTDAGAPSADRTGTGHADTDRRSRPCHDGQEMNAQDRERFERTLRTERRRIIASLLNVGEGSTMSLPTAAGLGAPALDRSEGTLLFLIDEALCTLYTDPDRFGVCRGCDEQIDEVMLEVAPWVDLCPSCEREAAKLLGLGS